MVEFDLPEFPPANHPTEGDQVPDFTHPLVHEGYWEDVSFSEFVAEPGAALLVFCPLNWGGKSRFWWKEIQERGWGDDHFGVVGIGISQLFDHQRFIEDQNLEYPLYSDPGNGVARQYDIVHDLNGMTSIEEPQPAVFLVDDQLTLEYAWVADVWPEAPPYDEVEAAFDEFTSR